MMRRPSCLTRFFCQLLLPLFTLYLDLEVSDASCTLDRALASWVKDGDLYYIIYDAHVRIAEARCLCASLPDSRLAVFHNISGFHHYMGDPITRDSRGGVAAYLMDQHPGHQFWVDAERERANSSYLWSNNCMLETDTKEWSVGEPQDREMYVRLQMDTGTQGVFYGIPEDKGHVSEHHYQPLCQSERAPWFEYLEVPPALTWVGLGALGHRFGFSQNSSRSLQGAREACARQAGTVSLASLEFMYEDVMDYVADNYPEVTFWVDATIADSGAAPPAYNWPGGGPVSGGAVSRESGTGLVMVHVQGTVHLVESAVQLLAPFICQGLPEAEPTPPPVTAPSLQWHLLGQPSRLFGFSQNKLSFLEAKEACAAQEGKVRLAILDTLFPEVAEWIRNNQRTRQYWVDVSRPVMAEARALVWGDGGSVDPSLWRPDEDITGDWAARIRYSGTYDGVYLDSTGEFDNKFHYLCERVSEVKLDWELLGSPGRLYGFSRSPSWGLHWARQACLRQAGDVTLATLDTHFSEVAQYVGDHYPSDTFWVDATREASDFVWSNGVHVNKTTWMTSEPHDVDKMAALSYSSAENRSAIYGFDNATHSLYFICQGNPTTLVIPEIFTSCEKEEMTMTTAATMTSETPPTDCSGQCKCNATEFKNFNLSSAELEQLVKAIQLELTVDKSTLSSTLRRKTSAQDTRPSAQATGSVGVIMLLLPVLFIVTPDVISLVRYVIRKGAQRRPKPRRGVTEITVKSLDSSEDVTSAK